MKMPIIALLAAIVFMGCGKKEDAAPAAKPEKAAEAPKDAPTPATTPAALAGAAQDDDVPTIADFEEAAEKDITKDNVEAEVDKLAKEIGE